MGNPATKPPRDPGDVFVEFHFKEIKDVSKSFLTLISATLVLSVMFAEKIVSFDTASFVQRWAMIFCWTLLIASLVCCGLGLYKLFEAGELAVGLAIYDGGRTTFNFRPAAKRAFLYLDLACLGFGGALLLLAIVAISKLV
jgi:hypothetical protein